MNEEIVFPAHSEIWLKVLVDSFGSGAFSFYNNVLDYNLAIEDLEGEELEQAMNMYSVEFSVTIDRLEHLMKGINEIIFEVGNAVPE